MTRQFFKSKEYHERQKIKAAARARKKYKEKRKLIEARFIDKLALQNATNSISSTKVS